MKSLGAAVRISNGTPPAARIASFSTLADLVQVAEAGGQLRASC